MIKENKLFKHTQNFAVRKENFNTTCPGMAVHSAGKMDGRNECIPVIYH